MIIKDDKKIEFSFYEKPESGHRNYTTWIAYIVGKKDIHLVGGIIIQ